MLNPLRIVLNAFGIALNALGIVLSPLRSVVNLFERIGTQNIELAVHKTEHAVYLLHRQGWLMYADFVRVSHQMRCLEREERLSESFGKRRELRVIVIEGLCH